MKEAELCYWQQQLTPHGFTLVSCRSIATSEEPILVDVSSLAVIGQVSRIASELPATLIIAFVAELAWLDSLRAAGAHTILHREMPMRVVVSALSLAAEGVAAFPIRRRKTEPAVAELSPEARTLLRELSTGLSIDDLSHIHYRSQRSMYRELHKLYDTIGVTNRNEALVWAVSHGVIAQ